MQFVVDAADELTVLSRPVDEQQSGSDSQSPWISCDRRTALISPNPDWLTATNRPISTRVTTQRGRGRVGAKRRLCADKDTYTNWSLRLNWKALAEMKRSLHDVMVLERREKERRWSRTRFVFPQTTRPTKHNEECRFDMKPGCRRLRHLFTYNLFL